MTAFNQVLTAEQETEQAIKTAKEETEAAVAAARNGHYARIEDETVRLNEIEKTTLAEHQTKVTEMTKTIKDDVAAEVSAIEQRFISHKSDLKAAIKQSFK